MILLKPFLFSIFAILVYNWDRHHRKHSSQGEETIRRFEREANQKVENIILNDRFTLQTEIIRY